MAGRYAGAARIDRLAPTPPKARQGRLVKPIELPARSGLSGPASAASYARRWTAASRRLIV